MTISMPNGIVILPYIWRGKTYKTLSGLCRAVERVHPGSAISFGQSEMHARNRREGKTYVYDVARSPAANEICDHYKARQ